MEWYYASILLAGGLIIALLSNIPIAISFGILNLIAAYFIFGSFDALSFLVQAAFSSAANIHLAAIPFFLLMGTLFVRTGLSGVVLDAVDRILSGIPASGCYVVIGSGALYGALMGASVASTAVMGATLLPELKRRGYSNALAIGPILGSGTLSNLIPPSIGAVLIGSLAGIPIGDLLLAGLLPAALIILLFCVYIYFKARGFRRAEEISERASLKVRLSGILMLMPLVVPVFCVTGVIYLGVATPTEASACGAMATFVVAMFYRKVNWENLKASVIDAVEVSAMILLIVASAKAYSQILAITGISSGISETLTAVAPSGVVAVIIILAVVLLLGCFMDQASVIFVTIPLVIQTIFALNIDPVWFGVLFSLVVGIGGITPPFGLNLFVLKAVAPPDVRLSEIYRICIPYIAIELAVVGILLLFPDVIPAFLATAS